MTRIHERDRDLSEPAPEHGPRKDDQWFSAITIASIVTMVVMAGLLMTPPQYEATAVISFDPGQIEDHWDLMKDETRVVDFEGQVRSRAVLAPALKEAGFEQKPSALSRLLKRSAAADEAASDGTMSGVVKAFQPYLTVERVRQSSLLRISVRLPSPEMAAKTANAVARSFFDLKRRQFVEQAQENLNAIEREMEGVQGELTDAMDARNEFLKGNGWNDYDLELTAVTNRVALLKQQLMKFETGGMGTIGELGQALPVTVAGNSALFGQPQDANLTQLLQKMNELDARYVQVKSRFKEDSPPVLELIREKQDLEDSIDDYVRGRKRMLSSQLETAQRELQRLLDAGSKVQVFKVAISQSETGYQKLMDQRSALRLQINSLEGNTGNFGALRLLDSAVAPETASFAARSLKLGATAVAAFIVSFSLLMIAFEMWHQVSGQVARKRDTMIDPAGFFKKII